MTVASLRLALLAGLALPLGLASAALAQPAPPPSAGPHGRADHAPRGDPAERNARMAAHLSDLLQLQPAQAPALDAWLAALQPPPGDMGPDAEPMTAPERLDRMLSHMDAMRAHLAQVAEATKRFYAQLAPAQRRAFDALAPMLMRHMGGHGHMMAPMMGGPPDGDHGGMHPGMGSDEPG